MLQGHPDRALVGFLIAGFTNGFNIGVEGEVGQGSVRNNFSALQRREGVREAIAKEIQERTISGPFDAERIPGLHCSPVTAADRDSGAVRLILDMSSPRGHSVNDVIDKDKFSCKYYLDDFLFAGVSARLCQQYLDSAINVCKYLQIPLAFNKVVGPTKVLTYLGIQIDTGSMTISLPQDKLHKITTLLALWENKVSCTKPELLSLIGVLSFACKIVKPGRTFL